MECRNVIWVANFASLALAYAVAARAATPDQTTEKGRLEKPPPSRPGSMEHRPSAMTAGVAAAVGAAFAVGAAGALGAGRIARSDLRGLVGGLGVHLGLLGDRHQNLLGFSVDDETFVAGRPKRRNVIEVANLAKNICYVEQISQEPLTGERGATATPCPVPDPAAPAAEWRQVGARRTAPPHRRPWVDGGLPGNPGSGFPLTDRRAMTNRSDAGASVLSGARQNIFSRMALIGLYQLTLRVAPI